MQPWYNSFQAHFKEIECFQQQIEDILYEYGVDMVSLLPTLASCLGLQAETCIEVSGKGRCLRCGSISNACQTCFLQMHLL